MRWLQRSGQVWCERVSEVENPPWTQHHTVHERRTEQKAAQPGLHTHINTHTVHKPTWTTTEPVNSWVRLQPVKPHWPQDIQQERGKNHHVTRKSHRQLTATTFIGTFIFYDCTILCKYIMAGDKWKSRWILSSCFYIYLFITYLVTVH